MTASSDDLGFFAQEADELGRDGAAFFAADLLRSDFAAGAFPSRALPPGVFPSATALATVNDPMGLALVLGFGLINLLTATAV